MTLYSVERAIGGKTLVIGTGKYAAQADGAVTVQCGDTIILATACVSPEPRADRDFFPLTVDYEERLYATGKIPGSFFRREGRPGQEAILNCRLTDRPLRPLFPKGFRNEVQIVITVLSVDRENPPEVLGTIGASAAVAISGMPFDGPVGATRVSHASGVYTLHPTYGETNQGDLSVLVAGTRDAIMMVEAGSVEVSEAVVLEAIRRGQDANQEIIDMIDELVSAAGRPRISFVADPPSADLSSDVNNILGGRVSQVLEDGGTKAERERALADLEAEVQEALGEQYPKEKLSAAFDAVLGNVTRSRILNEGVRPDGRRLDEIRPISCEVGVLPRTHGSGLFTRGETQVLSIATLASTAMKQKLDHLGPDDSKRFMHHYNFPPYSTGEIKRIFTGRRETGHGALAEKAIEGVVPSEEEFPYTIRLVSEVLSSNGSTSMASVCGSILALMDAGVPLKSPVAGVAMGLVMGENGHHAVLTDIAGMEDHLGDMDFKVAGTARGINALQLDVKVKGLTHEVLEGALEQARAGRLFILDKMKEVIAEPNPQLSPYAPRMIRMVIPVDKIGALIGPGGRTIRAIQEETGATIDTEDDGTVVIGSTNAEMLERARSRVEGLTRELTVGDIFTGKVVRLTSFGAFVALLPGKDGLLRLSELGEMEDGLSMGQELTVIVKEIDSMGRVNLSRRDLFDGPPGAEPAAGLAQRPNQPGAPFRGGTNPGFRGAGQQGFRRPPPGQGGQGRRPPPRRGPGGF